MGVVVSGAAVARIFIDENAVETHRCQRRLTDANWRGAVERATGKSAALGLFSAAQLTRLINNTQLSMRSAELAALQSGDAPVRQSSAALLQGVGGVDRLFLLRQQPSHLRGG